MIFKGRVNVKKNPNLWDFAKVNRLLTHTLGIQKHKCIVSIAKFEWGATGVASERMQLHPSIETHCKDPMQLHLLHPCVELSIMVNIFPLMSYWRSLQLYDL